MLVYQKLKNFPLFVAAVALGWLEGILSDPIMFNFLVFGILVAFALNSALIGVTIAFGAYTVLRAFAESLSPLLFIGKVIRDNRDLTVLLVKDEDQEDDA